MDHDAGSADVPSAFHKSLARFGSLSAYGAGGRDVRAPSGTALGLFTLNQDPFELKAIVSLRLKDQR
jgi:hypothetical protein